MYILIAIFHFCHLPLAISPSFKVRGIVCFESAYGKYLCVEPDGKVVADRSWDNSWEQFRLERFTGPGTQPNGRASDSNFPFSRDVNSKSDGGDGSGGGSGGGGGGGGGDAVAGVGVSNEALSSGRGGATVYGPREAETRDRFALRTYHGQYLR